MDTQSGGTKRCRAPETELMPICPVLSYIDFGRTRDGSVLERGRRRIVARLSHGRRVGKFRHQRIAKPAEHHPGFTSSSKQGWRDCRSSPNQWNRDARSGPEAVKKCDSGPKARHLSQSDRDHRQTDAGCIFRDGYAADVPSLVVRQAVCTRGPLSGRSSAACEMVINHPVHLYLLEENSL